ncbi:hypothetical protein ACRN9C_00575 [Shewanella frigidimarina]|uniref:hypothetical protein n=1 Tax=Shewanella frigidimarina TaxID=56812 RepID=UPI003D7A0A86
MANKQKITPPPRNNAKQSPDGGASESTQLDWVLQGQSLLVERVVAVEVSSRHMSETLERIEKMLERQHESNEKLFEKFQASQDKHFEKYCQNQEKIIDKQIAAQDKALELQRTELEKTNSAVAKINKTIAWATGAIVAATAVAAFMINGQMGKVATFMEQQKQVQHVPLKPVVTDNPDQAKSK